MDVHQGALLGQHALAYTVLSFFAITIHRRLLWFTVPSQAAQVLPLFLVAHTVELVLRTLAGGQISGILHAGRAIPGGRAVADRQRDAACAATPRARS